VTRHAGGCATCHNTTFDLTGKTAHCADCHTAEGPGTPPASYHRETDVIHSPLDPCSVSCARCHETTNVRDLHACSTCHVTYGCTECHRMHNAQPGTPLLSGLSCSRCHATQGTDYHKTFAADHTDATLDAFCQTSGCHSSNLVASHQAYVGPGNRYPQYSDTCALCHLNDDPDRVPANATAACSSCHADLTHASAAHGGDDASATADAIGCSTDADAGHLGCHDISDVSKLHATATGGCSICHGAGKMASTDCRTCHPDGGGAASPGSLGGTQLYHHNNVKYLADAGDAVADSYYVMDPAHGWNEPLYQADCTTKCHVDVSPPLPPEDPDPTDPFYAYPYGTGMWWSGGAHGKALDRMLTLAPTALPDGAKLEFDTWYRIEGADAEVGFVEVSADGGDSWTPLAGTTTDGAPLTSDDSGLGQGIQGISMGWKPAVFDLSAYAGQTVMLRFRFHAPGMTYMKGWAIDDIELSGTSGTVFSDAAEAGVLSQWSLTHTGEVAAGYPPDWTISGMQ
jgi:hypothetical protein